MTFCFRSHSLTSALLLANLLLTACIVSSDYAEPTAERVLPGLLVLLKDSNPELRRTAAQSLGKIASKEAVPALVASLQDPDAGVRRNAAWALGMIGEESVGLDRSPLGPLLFDPDPGVREASAIALGQTGDTQTGIELLAERLQEPTAASDSKRLAAAALGAMEAPSALVALTKLLQDRDPQVRRAAVAALGEIADQQSVRPLGELLKKDPDAGVRIEAAFRLGKFGGKAAEPVLSAALKDADENVRRLAKAALDELGSGVKKS
jgi:HEAT repeat protein